VCLLPNEGSNLAKTLRSLNHVWVKRDPMRETLEFLCSRNESKIAIARRRFLMISFGENE
jgi:hypothetical protein